MHSIIRCTAGLSCGGAIAGNTQRAESLLYEIACGFGKIFVSIAFSEDVRMMTVRNFLNGIVMVGGWAALLNSKFCTPAVASMVMAILQEIQSCYREDSAEMRFLDKQTFQFSHPKIFQVNHTFECTKLSFEGFMTVNTILPDYEIVSELLMISYGFANASIIAPKLVSCLSPIHMSSLAPK